MWDLLQERWVAGDPLQPSPEIEHYYRVKYQLVVGLHKKRPIRSIVEIGVRAGYSALAMLAAVPDATYLGIDADAGEWGGKAGYIGTARETLEGFQAEFLRADSQLLQDLPAHYSLAHVDGDHSYEGALRDIRLCSHFADAMIIDDYDFIPQVRHAANEFAMNEAKGWGFQHVPDNGFRGNLVCLRREVMA
jgi:hypothetical protein